MGESPAMAGTTGKPTIIRRPTDFDRWDELLALILGSFRYMNDVIDPPSSALRLTPESLRKKAAEETVFLAYVDRRLTGCVFLAEKDDHFYLGKLAIDTARQGRGIGHHGTQAALRQGQTQAEADHAATGNDDIRLPHTRLNLAQKISK